MSRINVGDKVFVRADAPEEYISGKNVIFTKVVGDVHRISKGIAEVGVWCYKLHVPVEYCAHEDDMEARKILHDKELSKHPELAAEIKQFWEEVEETEKIYPTA